MFDTIKTLTMGADAPTAKAATAELIKLVKFAREHKIMLEAALNQVETRSAGLMQTAKSLERVEKRAVAAGGRLDDLDEQVNTLTTRVRAVDEVGPRVEAVTRRADEAESFVTRLLSPDGDLQRLRESLQRLEAEAAENRASIDSLKKERSRVDEVRLALRDAQQGAAASTSELARLRSDVESLRALTPDLKQEYDRLRASAREEREYADTVMGAVTEIEKKIGALTALDELSKSTEERLAALNSLSEHVSLKVKALEGQRGVVERALVESNRLNEMVWSMDTQISKLADGAKQITKTEELIDRLQTVAAETSAELESGAKAKDDLTREIAKTQRESKEFSDFARSYMERIDLARKEADALGQRLSSLNSGMGEVESRLDAAAVKERSFVTLGQRLDTMAQRVDDLGAQSEDLSRKHEGLKQLDGRLENVEELAKRTTTQMDTLARARQDLEALRTEFHDLSKIGLELARTRDSFSADRVAMEAAAAKLAAFQTEVPELDRKLDSVTAKLSEIDVAAAKAVRIGEDSVALEQQISRLNARAEFVDMVHNRVNDLANLAVKTDRQLEAQLSRKAELEQMKTAADGLVGLVVDVEQKLGTLSVTQGQLMPLTRQVSGLERRITKVADGVTHAEAGAAAVADQEKRLAALLEDGRSLSADVAARVREVRGLMDEVKSASSAKGEISAELGQVQTRQREVSLAIDTADEQIRRVESLFEQLEGRRVHLLGMEKSIAAFETRVDALKEGAAGVEQQIRAVAKREQIVGAVKAQADAVRDVAASAKADLDQVLGQRGEVSALRQQIDQLLASTSETDEKIRLVEERKSLVETVQAQTNTIVNMMGDVRVTLETLTEHSAVMDVVADKVSRLDFAVQQAQNTLHMLQQERELAEQIDRARRQLRRKENSEDQRRTA